MNDTQTRGYPTRLDQAQYTYCFRLNVTPHQPKRGPHLGDSTVEDDPKFYDEKAERFRAKVMQDLSGQYMQHLHTHYLLEGRPGIFDHESLVEGEYK